MRCNTLKWRNRIRVILLPSVSFLELCLEYAVSYKKIPEMSKCSWPQRRVHANIHRWCFVSAYLWQEMDQPWCSSSRLWFKRLLHLAIRVQAVLDHQELVGEAMGRTRVLPAMQGARHVWDEHNGFCCDDTDLLVVVCLWKTTTYISKFFIVCYEIM